MAWKFVKICVKRKLKHQFNAHCKKYSGKKSKWMLTAELDYLTKPFSFVEV